jgi:uncharacterized protein (DUF885 family)
LKARAHRSNVLAFAAALAIALPAIAAESASQRLAALAAEAYERALDLNPLAETFGKGAGPRQDRLELTFTDEHRERQRSHHRWVLAQLEQIPAESLAPREKLTRDLLAFRSRESLDWLSVPFHQHHIFIQIGGGLPFNLVRLVGRQPFRNEADYRAWLKRLALYPQYIDGVQRVMREGLANGITIPRVLVEHTLPQVDSLAPGSAIEKSALWKPMTQFPESVNVQARASIEAEYRRLLADRVLPSLQRLAAFVRTEYLPKARTSDGIGALPGGAGMYRIAVRSETTTDMTPDAIHELGLKEVKRIQAKLLEAGARAGFAGPVSAMRAWLAKTPANYPFESSGQVLEYLNRLHAHIVPQLPRLFGRLPKARFEIRATDPAIAASAPAQWYPPSDDGTQPGIFAIPIVNPKQRSIFGLASLLAHEGMPGHHFDGGIKLENDVPEFRRRLWVNAFGEGWALYAESLGHELGLYDEPLALMGRYADELYRAGRLVVDTGLHAKGWTREQAIRFMIEECAMSQAGATNEVLRYMAWPGQALGYKIGELTILELRANAEKRLGPRFDIRAFHDAFLAEGHLPLTMAKARMEAWLAAQAAP